MINGLLIFIQLFIAGTNSHKESKKKNIQHIKMEKAAKKLTYSQDEFVFEELENKRLNRRALAIYLLDLSPKQKDEVIDLVETKHLHPINAIDTVAGDDYLSQASTGEPED